MYRRAPVFAMRIMLMMNQIRRWTCECESTLCWDYVESIRWREADDTLFSKGKKGAEAVVVDPWYRCSCMLSFTITQAAVAIICLLSGALLNTEHGVCIASDPTIRRRSSLAVDVCRSRVCVVFERNQLSVGDMSTVSWWSVDSKPVFFLFRP